MYPQLSDETMISDYSRALEKWFTHSDEIPIHMSSQRSWDNLLIYQKIDSLSFDSQLDKARFLASTVKESNSWLTALPSKSIANFPSMREPPGMFRDDKKRVDGVTLIPWCNGQLLVWDATCSDTLAPSYLRLSSKKAGLVARKAADVKLNRYKELLDQGYFILPFAVETFGPWCEEAIRFVDILGNLIFERTGEGRSKTYLKQRIGIALQRSNAACVMGTFRENEFERLDEIFYIL
ncbi:uncharacterized protein LOC119070553 [Bradysia coprophila]|uniref:uncharacterized protein LOC119070553 n=1 Tax=Bradysia coprophila TaxID=38358 RepID=UPI00187D8B57|nr:uncharacterized protein LOC119070553 [Bradysia coprophila]